MIRSTQAFLLLFLLLCIPGALATASPIQPVGLSKVIKDNLSGIVSEEAKQGSWTLLRRQAREFIEFRKGRMEPRAKLEWISSCLARPGENLFCEFMADKRAAKSPLKSDAALLDAGSLPLVGALEKADLPGLRDARETQLHRLFRGFPEWAPLQPVADAVLGAKECTSAPLAMALAQKAEEFFPAGEFRQRAISLYRKALECDGADEAVSQKSLYRLSLLEIWDGKCDLAVPRLGRLADVKGGDYVSRALYWRVHCAQALGQAPVVEESRSRLLKEFPLTYHGLLLSRGDGGTEPKDSLKDSLMKIQEPAVRLRSQTQPELNPLVRAAEVLQLSRANELAVEVLESVAERMKGSETSFRLYVAVLLHRAGDRIGQFRTLSGIFRDEPAAISRATLELFYPLQRFEVLRRNGARVDPFLVAALIRQESGFNERARSPAGALGLMQLMPATARRMERVSRRELMDPKTNIRLGSKYFHRLMQRYESDAELALAAYNAGPEKVDEWRKRYPTSSRVLLLDLIPFSETREYVALISRNYFWYLSLYAAESRSAAKRPPVFSALGAL